MRQAFGRFRFEPSAKFYKGKGSSLKFSLSFSTTTLKSKHGFPYRYIDPTSSLSESSIEAFDMPSESRANFLKKGIKNLFPIQASVWSEILEGKDLLARARTGTGKTLAFALPIISKISKEKQTQKSYKSQVKALIIAPTRELATQISASIKEFSPPNIYSCVCYGGININPQIEILSRGVDIVIGTPGRLEDLHERGYLKFQDLDFVVLDEADFMLDLGFKVSLENILGKVNKEVSAFGRTFPQMLLFSATVPEWVTNTAKSYFQRAQKIFVDAVGETTIRTSEKIKQVALAYRGEDLPVFVSEILSTFCPSPSLVPIRALVFCDTKRQVSELASGIFYDKSGNDSPLCGSLHGDLSQNQRNETLDAFKSGRINVLVATDVAARGLDIADVDVVIQLNPPPMVETFIHRSGRTARAGKGGINVLIYNPETNLSDLTEIEKTAGFKFSRQALDVGRTLRIKDKDTFTQIVKGVPIEEKNQMESVVKGFLESNANSHTDTILALSALLHRSFPSSYKITRSALTGEKGFVTMQFTPSKSCFSISELISSLESATSISKLSSQISVQKLTLDKKSLVFDVPIDICKSILLQNELPEAGKDGEIITVHEIPQLSNDKVQLNKANVSYGSMRTMNSSPRGSMRNNYSNNYNNNRYNDGGQPDYYRNEMTRNRYGNNSHPSSNSFKNNYENFNRQGARRDNTGFQRSEKSTTWDLDAEDLS